MKKILLCAVAIFAAANMSAQEVFQVNGEDNHGLTSDLKDLAAGYEWGTTSYGRISNAFATQHKVVDCKNDNFNKVIFDGNEILTKQGVQGNDNPKDADGGNPALTLKAATEGAVVQINAEKDGWAYLVGKLSSNKQYVVFENKAAVGYKLAMESADDRATNGVLAYTLEGVGEYNEIEMRADGTSPIQWVIRIIMGDDEATTAGNGLGYVGFPIYAGCEYYVHATGSKVSWSGIYFADAEASSIVVEGEDGDGNAISRSLTDASTGVQTIEAANVANPYAPMYNVAGQQVNASYKGIVLQNGKKFINK